MTLYCNHLIRSLSHGSRGTADLERKEVRSPRKHTQRRRQIGSWSVCRVREPILSRPVGWRRSALLGGETPLSRTGATLQGGWC
jgi:hypothetical protein